MTTAQLIPEHLTCEMPADADFKTRKLLQIFNQLFSVNEKTILQMGASEPFYRAAKGDNAAVIYAREDYFSSALHEIAHWSIAGVARRKLDDFGYWYEPEGRSQQQQIEFEQVEVKPQAVEWLLSLACNHPFHFSADNLCQSIDASHSFKKAVTEQSKRYLKQGLPTRAQLLFEKLNAYFRSSEPVDLKNV